MRGKESSRLEQSAGYSAIEALTAVGVMSAMVAFAAPNMLRLKAAQEVQSAASQVGGMLQRVRARAVSESTPYLVEFQKEEVSEDGRSSFARIARDNDRSYSITPADDVEDFALDSGLRPEVRQYGVDDNAAVSAEVRAPESDYSGRISNSGSGSASSGSGSSGSGSGSSGEESSSGATSTEEAVTSEALADRVNNGTTFPTSEDSGQPTIAFNERGIPVSPDSPTDWGTGAGAVYLTDNESVTYAAVVSPLGEVSLSRYDASSGIWK